MNKVNKLFVLILLIVPLLVGANPGAKSKENKSANRKGRSFGFDDLIVRGRYRVSIDPAVKAEREDMALSYLLDFRTNFRERIKISLEGPKQ